MTPTIETLALEFSQRLRNYLTEEQMVDVVRRNLAETSPGICHSHDFCDANMFLYDVFMKYGMNPVEEGGMDLYRTIAKVDHSFKVICAPCLETTQ